MSATPPYICSPQSDHYGSFSAEAHMDSETPSPTLSKTAGRSRAPKGSTNILKNPDQVKRRNARERRRVQAVNMAFLRLRDHVPGESKASKKISKVDTLRAASEYIHYLQSVLDDSSSSPRSYSAAGHFNGPAGSPFLATPAPGMQPPAAHPQLAFYPTHEMSSHNVCGMPSNEIDLPKEALTVGQFSAAAHYFMPMRSQSQNFGNQNAAYFPYHEMA